MRKLNEHYDVVFCDIDDTLIHGIWTDIMNITWKVFHNNTLSDLLMALQAIFKIYTPNHKLVRMLKECKLPVIFLTARKSCAATGILLESILGDDVCYGVLPLQTDTPEIDKIDAMIEYAVADDKRCCIFDDNERVRREAMFTDIDAFDPTPMFEEVVQ